MWGSNEDGVLGVNSSEKFVNIPSAVIGFEGVTVVKIICGDRFTVIVSDIGEVYSWGKNNCGQLGLGDISHPVIPYPSKIKHLSGIVIEGIAVGHDHIVAWSCTYIYSSLSLILLSFTDISLFFG